MQKLFISLVSLIAPLVLFSQQVPVGSWLDHLSYTMVNSVAFDGEEVFCGTESGVFSYNLNDNSIARYSTINILSDVACQKLAINPKNKVLCVFYKDGNIDLIKNSRSTNIPFIKNSNTVSDKEIRHVGFYQEYAFISYSFGLIKLNTEKKEISETYNFDAIGNDLMPTASMIFGHHLYVTTNKGLYKGNINSNLLDFNNWSLVPDLPQDTLLNAFVFNNDIYVVASGKPKTLWRKVQASWQKDSLNMENLNFIEPLDEQLALVYDDSITVLDLDKNIANSYEGFFKEIKDIAAVSDHHIFLASQNGGLLEYRDNHYIKTIKPNGPEVKEAYDMEARNNYLWVVRGGMKNHWTNIFHYGQLFYFDGNKWHNQNPWSHPFYTQAYDFVDIVPDPLNDDRIYICSWGGGLLELHNNTPVKLYNDDNSTIVSRTENTYYGIGGGAFDKEGNLWITNSYHTSALSVKKTDGSWKNFDLTGYVEFTTTIGDLVVSNVGHKWMLLPRSNEIIVYDDKNTISDASDDRVLKLTSNVNNGNIPGVTGITVEMDKNGDAWAGSNNGIFVFYNADNIFENYKTGAQRIIIDGGENYEILLESISVKDIEIDGANRKWIATDGSGVYLISEDGKEQIHHFTMENSPLFSNVVGSLAIDDKNGLVYMGTDKGIIAYRSDATRGNENFSEIKISPNPVKPDYHGPITISGLMGNSTVKITDISGTLINEIQSNGGQAIWNGMDYSGNRASTGVYLLFNSAMDEENQLQTEIAKILFVK